MAGEVREPRKPRVFKEFVIDELSAVDIPAQQPALIAIRKDRGGDRLSDRIKDPSLSDEEKRKLAMKLNPEYGKGIGYFHNKLRQLGRRVGDAFSAEPAASTAEGRSVLGELDREKRRRTALLGRVGADRSLLRRYPPAREWSYASDAGPNVIRGAGVHHQEGERQA